jgi:oligopeptide transport system substrate-binding protein
MMTKPYRCNAVAIAALMLSLCWLSPAGAATWEDPAKVLRVTFPVAETGFDPAPSQDYYSSHVLRMVFDSLYVPDYLARSFRPALNTAAAMPAISADGLIWTIPVRKGIYFADDPVFKGKKRELTAADYIYAWKRLVDPKVRSPNAYYLNGKLVGLDAAVAKARASGAFDYNAEIPGLRAIDRYTMQLKLVEPDYTLMDYLLQSSMAAVSREAIEAYGDSNTWTMDHPVGTGPYMLKEWRRGQKMVLVANPGYREEYFPPAPDGADATTKALVLAMKGKRLPQIGRIEITIIEESNPQLLAFNTGMLEYMNVPPDLIPRVLGPKETLLPEYADAGVTMQRIVQPSLAYTYFNMEDPVVGGYTPDKIALRRAIVMAFNNRELIDVSWQGQAASATQLVPPDMLGHLANIDVRPAYDPALARALLDRFGYKDRHGDGFRDLPDGKPLALVMGSTPVARDRDRDELWTKDLAAIGIKISFIKQKWPELLKMGRDGNQLQMWGVGWINSSGDGDAFMQLLYGPNAGQSNIARFHNADYDKLYLASKRLPAGPERDELYRKMNKIFEAYTPWDVGIYRYENTLVRPWVLGYQKNPSLEHPWKYLDIDVARLQQKK